MTSAADTSRDIKQGPGVVRIVGGRVLGAFKIMSREAFDMILVLGVVVMALAIGLIPGAAFYYYVVMPSEGGLNYDQAVFTTLFTSAIIDGGLVGGAVWFYKSYKTMKEREWAAK